MRWLFLVMLGIICNTVWADQQVSEIDPWETMNRKIFAFNDTLDRFLVRPVSVVYLKGTPKWLRARVSRFFQNLDEVTVIVNDLLQLKWLQAASDSGRFLVNTTVGVVGIFDVASYIGLPKHDEDFAQTFAFWGFKSGPYLVLPFYGPSTVRGLAGRVPNWYYFSYYNHIDHVRTRNSFRVLEVADTRSGLIKNEALVRGDRYIFIRDAYLQQRKYLINDGQFDDEDDFLDDESWE